MNRSATLISLILGLLTVVLITGVQIYFVQKAFNQEEHRINQTIQTALYSVTNQMTQFNDADFPAQNPVQQIQADYFVVNVNGFIDSDILEHFLIAEFQRSGLDLDFEYGIYDCQTDDFVYGKYVTFGNSQKTEPVEYSFSRYSEYLYYFGIYFPGRTKQILNSLSVWYFFSAVLLFVLIFFVYSQIVILKQRRLSEIQKDFINNLTHEFRTPLSSVSMAAEVFVEQDVHLEPDRIKKYGRIVQDQSKHLISQIDRILTLSNRKSKDNCHFEEANLSILISQVYDEFQAKIAQVDGSFEINTAREDLIMHIDVLLIRQLLQNLLDNAIKYSDDSPVIAITVSSADGRGEIEIKDQGIGIPKLFQRRIFTRFFRVPKGNVHNVKGYGLGLYHVKQVARLHKWKIAVDSKENEGTRITLKFRIK